MKKIGFVRMHAGPYLSITSKWHTMRCMHAGPGFSLTFSVGNCTLDEARLLSKDGAIQCVGPAMTLERTPATFTSAYTSAATFTGQACAQPLHLTSLSSLLYHLRHNDDRPHPGQPCVFVGNMREQCDVCCSNARSASSLGRA